MARFLHDTLVRYNYENHRSNLYQETTRGVGVHRVLRPKTVYAKTKQYNIEKSRWSFLKESSRNHVVFGTHGQPLGQAIPRKRGRGPSERARTGSQTYTTFSMLSTEDWPGWERPISLISPKEPNMFIYFFSELLTIIM